MTKRNAATATVVAEAVVLPPVATDQPITANANATGDTALTTGTVATPTIGDNGAPDEPTRESLSIALRTDIAEFMKHTHAAEHVLQKMSFHIRQRHSILTAMDMTKVKLGDLITDNEARKIYLRELMDELFGEYVDFNKARMPDQVTQWIGRDAFRRRCQLGFELAIALDYTDTGLIAFNQDKGRWSVAPLWFAPHGYLLPAELLTVEGKPDGDRVLSVCIGDDGPRGGYYVTKRGGGGQPINLSITQFVHGVTSHARAKVGALAAIVEATAARQAKAEKITTKVTTTTTGATRAPAMAGSTGRSAAEKAKAEADATKARADALAVKADELAKADADKVAALTDEELGKRTEATADNRAWLVSQMAALLVSLGKCVNHDGAQAIAWTDLPEGARNCATDFVMWYDKRKADMTQPETAPNHDATTDKVAA